MRATLLALACIGVAAAADSRVAAQNLIDRARAECASLDAGMFAVEPTALTEHDLTGDGVPETLVDSAGFACSTALTLWGGSGGNFLWVIVDGEVHEFLAHRWRVVDDHGQPVLLLAVHHAECGNSVGPCYRALVWQDGFRTTTR